MPTAARLESTARRRRNRAAAQDDHGVSLLGLIVTLAIIGSLAAAIPLLARGSSGSDGIPGTSSITPEAIGHSTSGSVAAAGNDISAAEATACRTTYEAVEAAVGVYQAETGILPTSTAQLRGLIPDPLRSPFFTVTIDPRRPGQLQVATPDHAAADGDINCTAVGH